MVEPIPIYYPFLMNSLRYLLIAGIPFLIFYVLFPRVFSLNKIQARWAENRDMIREFLHSTQTTMIMGIIATIILQTPLKDHTQIYWEVSEFPMWYVPVSLVLALFIHDAYFYWMHRAIHHPKLYKRIHKVHHQSYNPTPWTAYSFHYTESVLELLIGPIILFILPMHFSAVIAYILFSLVMNVYAHLGFEIAPRWFRHSLLFEVVSASVFHNMHHERFQGNYGFYFRIWDRLMGTEHPDYVKEYDRIQERRFGKYQPKMNWALSSLLIFLFLCLGVVASQAQSPIEGTWKDHTVGATVKIYQENGLFYGQVIAVDDPVKNEQLQGKTVLVLRDFKQKDPNNYCCGTLHKPKLNITADGTLILESKDQLRIEGRYGMISQSRVWERL